VTSIIHNVPAAVLDGYDRSLGRQTCASRRVDYVELRLYDSVGDIQRMSAKSVKFMNDQSLHAHSHNHDIRNVYPPLAINGEVRSQVMADGLVKFVNEV
jgi:hypothetical protein